jgi:hypothetical protein
MTPSSVVCSSATPKYTPLALRVSLALDKIKANNCPGSRIAGLEKEARTLIQQMCLQQLQRELSESNNDRRTIVRPLIILHGCNGCGKRTLIRSACAAIDPSMLVSELDCTSLPTSADQVQNHLELYFASATRSNSAVLVYGAQELLIPRKFSSSSSTRFVTVLIEFLMEKQRSSLQQQSPCFITCSSPEFLDSNLRSLAVLELGVPSPSLLDRAAIIALYLESMMNPAISASVTREFSSSGKLSHALSLICQTMTGYRFAFVFVCR